MYKPITPSDKNAANVIRIKGQPDPAIQRVIKRRLKEMEQSSRKRRKK